MTISSAGEGRFHCRRSQPEGGAAGWMLFKYENLAGKEVIRVMDLVYDSAEALRRQLSFLGSLHDQYSLAMLILPVDLPLNLLLKETQVPHRRRNPPNRRCASAHSHAGREFSITRSCWRQCICPSITKDRLWSKCRRRRFHFQVSNRHRSRQSHLQTDGGLARCHLHRSNLGRRRDGNLPIDKAAQLELVQVQRPAAFHPLTAFSDGPLPFCSDGF